MVKIFIPAGVDQAEYMKAHRALQKILAKRDRLHSQLEALDERLEAVYIEIRAFLNRFPTLSLHRNKKND